MDEIKVTCYALDKEGNKIPYNTIPLDKLVIIQGALKDLTKKNYEKLKNSIITNGIMVPSFVWRDGERYCILDGTQREHGYKQMRQEGYVIPDIPVVFIEAANEQDAKKKILAISSQYGKITEQGLYEFSSLADIPAEFIEENFSFDALEHIDFAEGYGAEKEWEGMPEFIQEPLALKTIHIHFKKQEDIDEFSNIIKQKITESTITLWHPAKEKENHKETGYITDES